MKRREYFSYAKKIKITTFIQQLVSSLSLCVSVAPFWRASDGRKVRTFLCLDSVIYLAVNRTVTSLLVFIQNILNCVPRTNKAFTGLEGHGAKFVNDKICILGWSIPLTHLPHPQTCVCHFTFHNAGHTLCDFRPISSRILTRATVF